MQICEKLKLIEPFLGLPANLKVLLFKHSFGLSGTFHFDFLISLNSWHKSDNENQHQVCVRFFSGIYRFNILTVYCALPPTFNDGALTPRISLAGTLARLPRRSRIVSNSSRQMVRFSKAKFRPVTEFTAISFPLYRLMILKKFFFVQTFCQKM